MKFGVAKRSRHGLHTALKRWMNFTGRRERTEFVISEGNARSALALTAAAACSPEPAFFIPGGFSWGDFLGFWRIQILNL